jgi:N-acetylglutamate synthase-like GNAT family acetyltransferase
MTRRVEIRPATASDLPAAIGLLHDADLPTEDLTTEHLAFVAKGEMETLGVIGLETFGDVGLLRSLVVSPLARGEGVGRLLAEALELSVRESGMGELWLLTIDADAFFSKLGFRVRSRDAAPDAIRGSKEYSALCPGDAVLMSKSL